MSIKRTTLFAVIFWTIAFGFIAFDWSRARPHNRFDEPPPWQIGQDKVEGAGHCAMSAGPPPAQRAPPRGADAQRPGAYAFSMPLTSK